MMISVMMKIHEAADVQLHGYLFIYIINKTNNNTFRVTSSESGAGLRGGQGGHRPPLKFDWPPQVPPL